MAHSPETKRRVGGVAAALVDEQALLGHVAPGSRCGARAAAS